MANQNKKRKRTVLRDGADPIDIYVGAQLRKLRGLHGLSQQKLGDIIDRTFQQVQKYERGANRIGASNLFKISRALGVSTEFFYDGLDGPAKHKLPTLSRVQMNLIRSVSEIKNKKVVGAIASIAKAAASVESLKEMSESETNFEGREWCRECGGLDGRHEGNCSPLSPNAALPEEG